MYWANGLAFYKQFNKVLPMFTYSASTSIEEAKTVINKWKQDQTIQKQVLCAYIIDDTTGKVVYLENNVDARGNVSEHIIVNDDELNQSAERKKNFLRSKKKI